MAPSTTGRCGPKGGPIGPFTGGSNGSIRAHISSVNTAVRDTHPRSRPQHVQLVRHALGPSPRLLVCLISTGRDSFDGLADPGWCPIVAGRSARLCAVLLGEDVVQPRL